MNRKQRFLFLFILCFSTFFPGCRAEMTKEEDFIAKARKEIPISNADTIDLLYAGSATKGKEALLWFISGNEYQDHFYFVMNCTVKENGAYLFQSSYSPGERADDIAFFQWKGGYCFLVNNPACRTILIDDISVPVPENSFPFLYFYPLIPHTYSFLDADGKVLS